jgi:hypothetical protein
MKALTIKAKEARDWVLAAANRLSKVEEHAKVRPPTVYSCASCGLNQYERLLGWSYVPCSDFWFLCGMYAGPVQEGSDPQARGHTSSRTM